MIAQEVRVAPTTTAANGRSSFWRESLGHFILPMFIRPPPSSLFLLVPQKVHNQAGLVSLGTSIIWVATARSILACFSWSGRVSTPCSCHALLLPAVENCPSLLPTWQWQLPGRLDAFLAMTTAWASCFLPGIDLACCLPGIDNCLRGLVALPGNDAQNLCLEATMNYFGTKRFPTRANFMISQKIGCRRIC